MQFTLPYLRTFLSFLLIFFFALSCTETEKDFREKFVGQWMFQIDQTNYSSENGGTNSESSFAQIGEIKYGNNPGELLLKYGEDEALTFRIDEFGHMNQLPNRMCSGQIQGHNFIQMYLRWGDGRSGLIHEVHGQKLTSTAGL